MSDVSVIGLGEMGSALARAFLAGEKTVTAWSRNPARAAPLQAVGAIGAATVADAIAASPVTVICLSDYAATLSILEDIGVADTLRGRLMVQLTSGTPREARMLAGWVTSRGAEYLDGAIAAWPRHIGGPDAAVTVVGPEAVFSSALPLLKLLAGNVTYMGSDIGHAMAVFNAALGYFAGHWIGFSYGAAICEAEGIDPVDFGEMLAGLSPAFAEDMRHMGRVIADDRFGEPESSIRTVSADIARLVQLSGDLNIGRAFPTFAADIFQRAHDAGYSAEEHSAVIKVLRTH
ncbi:NAD(P)-dependent oxidoreductase [Rhizobium leguminosarum]|uniref:NAD(P)-dependent oxidoreductase n=2 Tax=Rhizobium leguminosarum TaxID=384 RepID=A0AAJ1EEM8_RHILE|nr:MULTISPECIES: NAD(P)-binding domain-containing protein [Rhizobium]MBY3037527.1 NAD(P)-dependent oxidoreductase [Rhizobium laguerreae]MBY3119074.1 NAD(P)-dependent oxidoreductase [Rhizobium laguerreae]MBY3133442.1 NAD(P)-dependent oxidoreductase [Rhizobium laguerreae]MBY3155011.1 NAD(P)-dependent oxidoreductase [Rhizobium laguerreae]MBY3189420.1 NAD(P)-dependent oxidoreductase [Rhizobium laguerreae]